MRGRFPVHGLGIGRQPLVDFPDVLPGAFPAGHYDREIGMPHLGRALDEDLELVGRIRQHVGRRVGDARGGRRPQEAVVFPGRLGDDVGLEFVIPGGGLPADSGRPHRLKHRLKAANDRQRLGRVHGQKNDRSGFENRGNVRRPDGERLKDIRQRRRLRRGVDVPDDVPGVNRLRARTDEKRQLAAAEKLQRIGPGLERPALRPENGERAAGLVEISRRTGRHAERQAGRFQGEPGNTLRSGLKAGGPENQGKRGGAPTTDAHGSPPVQIWIS